MPTTRSCWRGEYDTLEAARWLESWAASPLVPSLRLWMYEHIERALSAIARARGLEPGQFPMPGCDHTLRITTAWVHQPKLSGLFAVQNVDPDSVIASLRDRARCSQCDCELLMNVALAEDDVLESVIVSGSIEIEGKPAIAALEGRSLGARPASTSYGATRSSPSTSGPRRAAWCSPTELRRSGSRRVYWPRSSIVWRARRSVKEWLICS